MRSHTRESDDIKSREIGRPTDFTNFFTYDTCKNAEPIRISGGRYDGGNGDRVITSSRLLFLYFTQASLSKHIADAVSSSAANAPADFFSHAENLSKIFTLSLA